MAQEIRFSAPVLPIPTREYDSLTAHQHNNMLRIYFNQIDQALRELAVAAPKDFYSEVSKGNIAGHTIVHKYATNFDIDTGSVPETVWSYGGLYPWSALSTAQTLYCLSTDASDTGDLTIQGLDENFAPLSETVTLTGLSAVTTTNTFSRVFRMSYSDTNVGEITVRTVSGTGTVVAEVPVSYAQTIMAVYTIPAAYTGYLLACDITVSSNRDAELAIYQRVGGTGPFRIVHIAEVYQNAYRYEFPIPLRFTEKTDIEFRILNVGTNDTRTSVNFDVMLVDDAFLGQPLELY